MKRVKAKAQNIPIRKSQAIPVNSSPSELTNTGSPSNFSSLVVPVEVSENVRLQVDYLCKRVWQNEWSGIVFYSTEGKFATPQFKCLLEDVFPMNVGNSAFTSYDFNVDVVKYLKAHPKLHSCKIGHIHSHNFMGVFFSGEDEQELAVNCGNHNIYLSIIVNNRGEMIGRVAFAVTRTQTTTLAYSFLDENGTLVQINDVQPAITTTEYYKYQCEVIGATALVSDELKARCEELLQDAGDFEPAAARTGLPSGDWAGSDHQFSNALELDFHERANG
ncbi:MAG TPA: hypothetical protein VFS31_03435 [Chitinophagaceae bacterium]|nr:hypothetical protein [Chitinophagaceae bacterium]